MSTRSSLYHSLFVVLIYNEELSVSLTLSAFSAQTLFLTVERININNE